MTELRTAALAGSIPPLVTPFRNGAVDYDAYADLVEYQVRSGSQGVLVNGTTGEPSTLTVEERNRLVDTAVAACARRVPVVAATGSQSHAETAQLTEHAQRAGVDAILVVTPYYIRPSQRGLVEYYANIGRRTDKPLMIYHIPARAAVSVDLTTLGQIRERVPHLVGMKHASPDLAYASDVLAAMGADFRLFVGLEEFSLPMLALGACGLMNAVGNLAPRKVAELADRTAAGDMAQARRLHAELLELNKSVFYEPNPAPIKYMMKRLGLLRANEHRLPMLPASPELERRLDGVLQRAGLLA
ncbi:MAG TPA: 4-hydroxy-tetrahydrodipicolinate synthase [Caldimonas sp.]|nr:4-hydroxy-tetrahydrodipicolinate synthase [Caldimonas sp.]